MTHCHCEGCRRAKSAAFATYAGYPANAVSWSGDEPGLFRSSPGVVRRFCRSCGSPLSFEGERWPDEVHLFVASFDDPGGFAPTVHVHASEELPWVHLADGLPRYATIRREGPTLR